MEKTFMINQLIHIQNDMKKLDNQLQDKMKITILGLYSIMIISKIIID